MHFACFLWRGRNFERDVATYDETHVAILARMLERHGGHTLTCIHDGAWSMPAGVGEIRMPDAVAALPNYLPKLWAWSRECQSRLPRQFACVDLDVVLLGDLAPVLATDEPVRIWNSAVGEPYNSSLFTLVRGFGGEVWREMTPAAVERARARAARWTGDQSWIAHVLGPDVPTFGEETGVIRYNRRLHRPAPPAGTIAAFFCGPYSPATEREHSKWVHDQWK